MIRKMDVGARAASLLLEGVNEAAGVVGRLYGPKGGHAVLGIQKSKPIVVGSPNGILGEISYDNPGARLLQQAVTKVADTAGDGTGTTVLLTQALLNGSARLLASGANPVVLKGEWERLLAQAIQSVTAQARPVETAAEAARLVAAKDISTRELVARAFEGSTADGLITVRNAKSVSSYVEVLDSVEIDQGYLSEQMITDPSAGEALLDEPLILLTDQVISASQDIAPAMNVAKRASRPLVVMAQDVTGEALATLHLNNRNGKLRTLAVRATAFGERREEILQDLAVLTRSTVISQALGARLGDVTLAELGSAKLVRASAGHTYLVGGGGAPEEVERRVAQIKRQIETAVYEVDRVNLYNRLARLRESVTMIYVGAQTEAELHAKRQQVKSTVSAVRMSLKGGVVPGGGIGLLNAAREIRNRTQNERVPGAGAVFEQTLMAPLRQLLLNAGAPAPAVIAALETAPAGCGYDVEAGRLVNMLDQRIADSALMLCTALQTAVSVVNSAVGSGVVLQLT